MRLTQLLHELCVEYATAGDVDTFLDPGEPADGTMRGTYRIQQVVTGLLMDGADSRITVICGEDYDDGHLPDEQSGYQRNQDMAAHGSPGLRGARNLVKLIEDGERIKTDLAGRSMALSRLIYDLCEFYYYDSEIDVLMDFRGCTEYPGLEPIFSVVWARQDDRTMQCWIVPEGDEENGAHGTDAHDWHLSTLKALADCEGDDRHPGLAGAKLFIHHLETGEHPTPAARQDA